MFRLPQHWRMALPLLACCLVLVFVPTTAFGPPGSFGITFITGFGTCDIGSASYTCSNQDVVTLSVNTTLNNVKAQWHALGTIHGTQVTSETGNLTLTVNGVPSRLEYSVAGSGIKVFNLGPNTTAEGLVGVLSDGDGVFDGVKGVFVYSDASSYASTDYPWRGAAVVTGVVPQP